MTEETKQELEIPKEDEALIGDKILEAGKKKAPAILVSRLSVIKEVEDEPIIHQ